MNDAKSGEFACDRCGKRFRWTRSLAMGGRPVRCPCGNVMRVPTERPEHAEVHAEEHLHHDRTSSAVVQHSHHAVPADAEDAAHPVAPAHSAYPAPQAHAAAAAAPFNYQRQQFSTDPFDPDALKNFQMPLCLLVGGIVVDSVVCYFRSDSLGQAAQHVLYGLVAMTAVTLIAVLVAAKFREIQLGPLSTAVLKLAAIAAASTALYTLVFPIAQALPSLPILTLCSIPLGYAVSLLAYGVLSFALLGVFFDLDQSDAWYCVSVMIVISIGLLFLGKTLGMG